MIPGGASDNREFVQPHVRIETSVDKKLEPLLFDPQTSGGLFIAIAPQKAGEFEKALANAGLPSKPIGAVEAASKTLLVVV